MFISPRQLPDDNTVGDSNWTAAYVIVLLVPLGFVACALYSVWQGRRRKQRAADIEMGPYQSYWFPWRGARNGGDDGNANNGNGREGSGDGTDANDQTAEPSSSTSDARRPEEQTRPPARPLRTWWESTAGPRRAGAGSTDIVDGAGQPQDGEATYGRRPGLEYQRG